MKIVFICNEYPPGKVGGIGIFTKILAEGLAQAGHDIHVVGTYAGIKNKVEECINNVAVVRLPHKNRRIGLFINRVTLYKSLRNISLEAPIDILECPDFEGSIAYIPKLAKKTIIRLHGCHTHLSYERNLKPSAIISHLEKVQIRSADKVISVSQYTGKKTKNLFNLSKEPYVIYNSIDIDKLKKYKKLDYGISKKVIYFGSLSEKKGIYPLMKAWRGFIPNNKGWVLTVIGKDAYESGISNKEEMIKALGQFKDSVEFVEYMENSKLIESLQNYDFAVLPSFTESFAIAPLEAMGVGLPVIISGLSSGPEVIEHGIDGWLCNPYQSETIINMMTIASRSELLRISIADAAVTKIKNFFDFEMILERNLMFYEEILI